MTYNSLGFINYCAFSSSSKNADGASKEVYVGFAGKVYSAKEGPAKFVKPDG